MYRFVARHYHSLLILVMAVLVVLALALKFSGFGLTAAYGVLFLGAVLWSVFSIYCLRVQGLIVSAKLDNDCDPNPLLEFSRDQLRVFKSRNRRRAFYLGHRLNMAVASYSLGQYQEALDILNELSPLLPVKPTQTTLFYELNRAAILLHSNGREEARECIGRARALLKELKLAETVRKNVELTLAMNEHVVQFQGCEDFSKLELELLEFMARERLSKRVEVCQMFYLGKICLALGKQEQAMMHLRYVADNGNQLGIRREAEELLGQLAQADTQG